MEKKISIIIPVYNVEKYIEKCLQTVVNQTYKNIEIIVVIDGSKDKSESIVREFAKNDERIKILVKENEGLLKTRVRGLEMATGEYVFNLDSDDWLEENAIQRMLEVANKYQADMVRIRGIREYFEIGKSKPLDVFYKEETYIEKKDFKEKFYNVILNTFMYNSIWGELIRRDIIDVTNLDTSIHMGEDLNFNLEIYKNMKNIVFIPDILYHYRYNYNSISKSTNTEYVYKKATDMGKVYYKLLNYLENWEMDSIDNKKKVAKKLLKSVSSMNVQLVEGKNANKEKIMKYINNTMNLPEIECCRNILTIEDIKDNKLLKYFYIKDTKKYYGIIKRRIYPKLVIKKKMYNIYAKIYKIIRGR